MALAAAGGGDRTLSDASLPFHIPASEMTYIVSGGTLNSTHSLRFTATAPTDRHHSRNITWAQPLVMPSAHVAHAPILY